MAFMYDAEDLMFDVSQLTLPRCYQFIPSTRPRSSGLAQAALRNAPVPIIREGFEVLFVCILGQ